MRTCGGCSGDVDARFRFGPWCGAPQRLKLVEFFHPHPLVESDQGKALRVSRYLGGEAVLHVRLSVWSDGPAPRAEAAISLDEEEAERLTRFLAEPSTVKSTQA